MAASQKLDPFGALTHEAHARRIGVDPPPVLLGSNVEWRDRGTTVEILVEVTHDGDRPTAPARLIIESAPLGAFVSWSPLAFIDVGPMMPGERRTLSTVVARAALPSIPPLPAAWRALALAGGGSGSLPPDDADILSPPEWAGNLNVWFETAPEGAVEVHRALNLEVRARRYTFLAVFVPPERDGYEANVECQGAGWTAELSTVEGARAALCVHVPVAGRRAVVNLVITRRCDARQVTVDLRFRSVEGRAEEIGCVST